MRDTCSSSRTGRGDEDLDAGRTSGTHARRCGRLDGPLGAPSLLRLALHAPEARPPVRVLDPTTYRVPVIRGVRPGRAWLRTIAVYFLLLFRAGRGWVSGGCIGVDLFFCLSGCLVPGVLLGEVERVVGLRVGRFYGRRG